MNTSLSTVETETMITPQEAAASTREQTEIQSAIVTAKRFPRNEPQAFVKAIKAFSRSAMADAAAYSFPRGGKTVAGPSVHCARELARLWGNIRYGVRVVSQNESEVHIKAYAADLETNCYVEAEDAFNKLVQRKNKISGDVTWVQPDERDLRELVNRRGAIAVRNCLLQILPSDLVDDVMKAAKRTLQIEAANGLEKSREDVVKSLVVHADRIGVSVTMIETYLGHRLDIITAEEVAELKSILGSIREGQAKREEFFKVAEESRAGKELTDAASGELNSLKAKLKKDITKEHIQGV